MNILDGSVRSRLVPCFRRCPLLGDTQAVRVRCYAVHIAAQVGEGLRRAESVIN